MAVRIWILSAAVAFSGCISSLSGSVAPAVSFSGLREQMLSLPEGRRQAFWNLQAPRLRAGGLTLPEISGTEVLFLLESPGSSRVTIYGDLVRWTLPGAEMHRIPGTSVFWLKRGLDARSLVKYRFLPEAREARAHPDPWNPRTETSGRRTDSLVIMPDYNYPETVKYPGVPEGSLEKLTGPESWFRTAAGKERLVWFYESPQGPKKNSGPRPFLLFGDGKEIVETSRLPVILDNLVAAGELEPVCALFISPLNRDAEYLGRGRQEYLDFLRHTLVPRLEAEKGRVVPLGGSPDRRVLTGASNGGEFVLWAGSAFPDFSLLIFNQSGIAGNEAMGRWLKREAGSRVYTLVGAFERDLNLRGAESLHRALDRNPAVVNRWTTLPQGHTWRLWGDGFRAGILWLLYGVEDPGVFPVPGKSSAESPAGAAPESASPFQE